MKTITVNASKAYDILIGAGLLGQSGALIAERLRPQKALIISDTNVRRHGYVETLEQSLTAQGIAAGNFTLHAGEAHKNLASYEEILRACAAFELTGSDVLIALGGGVVGDLTGFAAATWRRGIRYAQIPTTLLAAVDSSVGGKTGLNLAAGKNLAGAFWQPGLVICDPGTLITLPREELANGMAECLKYGVLFDEALFAALEQGSGVTQAQIARCVELKRDIVAADENDTGPRRLLNLGHTLGHAIEQASGYVIPHGSAIGIGMVLISKAFCPAIVGRLRAALERNHLPVRCDYSIEELFAALSRDKKRHGDEIAIVVPLRIGRCELRTLKMSELKTMLEERL